MPSRPPDSPADDPLLRHSRREALLALALWLAASTYSVVYCYLRGYQRPVEGLKFVCGFPDWVFWGIVTPWVLCVLVSCWFALVFLKDDPLGDDPDQEASASAAEEMNDV